MSAQRSCVPRSSGAGDERLRSAFRRSFQAWLACTLRTGQQCTYACNSNHSRHAPQAADAALRILGATLGTLSRHRICIWSSALQLHTQGIHTQGGQWVTHRRHAMFTCCVQRSVLQMRPCAMDTTVNGVRPYGKRPRVSTGEIGKHLGRWLGRQVKGSDTNLVRARGNTNQTK